MKTPCAFHPGQTITQFCKCPSCLLPLCPQCTHIHLQQHKSLSQPISLQPIEHTIAQISSSISSQFTYIDTINKQTLNKYNESEQQHRQVFQQIVQHRDTLLKAIHSTYDSIIREIESNARRRELWVREFGRSVQELRGELAELGNLLQGEKYLRVVIMWNRMRPDQEIQVITKKAEKKWLVPQFVGLSQDQLVGFVANHTNLKVLEIEGDSGVQKILNIIRVLRYGEVELSSSTRTSSTCLQQSSSSTITTPTSTSSSQLKANHQLHPGSQVPPSPVSQNIPMYFSSPNRKNSSRKLEVLSSLGAGLGLGQGGDNK